MLSRLLFLLNISNACASTINSEITQRIDSSNLNVFGMNNGLTYSNN